MSFAKRWILATLLLAGPAAAQTRVTLPTDSSLSAYVGVQAEWQSLVKPTLPPRTRQMATDVSVYELSQTPSRASFADHELTLMPVPDDTDWYVFRPTSDNYNLVFDIADTSKRMVQLVVTDLDTGQVLGNIASSADGSSIVGQLSVPWTQPYVRVDGYAANNVPLFRLAASNGGADRVCHFAICGQFMPYRPATQTTQRFAGGDGVIGTEGNPYNRVGISIQKMGDEILSRGCTAADATNDVCVTNPLLPPEAFLRLVKLKCIGTVDVIPFLSQDLADLPSLITDVNNAAQEDDTRALTELTMLPFSDNTGHWHVKLLGHATAFFVVPYTVAKNNTLYGLIKTVFGTLAANLVNAGDKLTFSLTSSFVNWLGSDAGKQSGLKAGMVIPIGDVMTVKALEELKAMPIVKPILQDVTFTLQPDQALSGWTGTGRIGSSPVATTTPAAPTPAYDTALSFSSTAPAVTRALPKGYRYTVAGCVNPAAAYVSAPASEFMVPGSTSVTIPCTLNALFTWTIYTETTGVPAGPVDIVIKSSAGAELSRGTSSLQADGRYAFTPKNMTFWGPGVYTVTAERYVYGPPPPVKYTAAVSVPVAPGLLQETTVTLTKQ